MRHRIGTGAVVATLLALVLAGSARADVGYYGWGLKCSDCTLQTTEAGMQFRFSSLPEVSGVEPGGPADRAGIRPGDVLVSVDGRSLTEDEGADRLTSVQPGTAVRVGYRRGSQRRDARIIVGSRSDGPSAPAEPPEPSVEPTPIVPPHVGPSPDAPVRFAGEYHGLTIEVRGSPNVRVLMPADDSWMEIVSGDIRVRIRRDAAGK